MKFQNDKRQSAQAANPSLAFSGRTFVRAAIMSTVVLVATSAAMAQPISLLPPTYYTYDTTTNVGAITQSQMITNRILANVLLGGNEQINCSNCVSAFGSVGSFSAGAHGRYNFNGQLSILGGVAISQYHGKGYQATSVPILAGAFRYDFADSGWARPYIDVGLVASPGQSFRITRNYFNGGVPATGIGKPDGNSLSAFAKAGWVFRVTGRDEISVFGEVWRSWQRMGSYVETPVPPMPAIFPAATDVMTIGKIGAQWTHLWGTSIETHLNGGVARTFGTSSSLHGTLNGVGALTLTGLKERTYFEYGARIGYRITPKLVLDVFANGAIMGGPIGNQIHVGSALRYHY